LVLAAAFAAVKVAVHTTTTRVTGVAEPAADVWTDYSGTLIYAAFAGVAAVNCLVTVVVNRRREMAIMQLLGGSRRSLVTMTVIEAGVVSAATVVLAIGVAGVTLVPMLHSSLGRWLPYFPPVVPVVGVALVGCLVVVGMAGPAAALTRTRPIDVVGDGP
jgi:putative ABC transport system permease protein